MDQFLKKKKEYKNVRIQKKNKNKKKTERKDSRYSYPINGLYIFVVVKKSADTSTHKVREINFEKKSKTTEELRTPIIKKFQKRKVYSTFKDNIWGPDLTDKQLIGKYNKKRIPVLLRFTDTYSKYAWIVPLNVKEVLQLIMLFKQF